MTVKPPCTRAGIWATSANARHQATICAQTQATDHRAEVPSTLRRPRENHVVATQETLDGSLLRGSKCVVAELLLQHTTRRIHVGLKSGRALGLQLQRARGLLLQLPCVCLLQRFDSKISDFGPGKDAGCRGTSNRRRRFASRRTA